MGPFEQSSLVTGGVGQLRYLFRLPLRVAWFYVRALAIALRRGDRRSLVCATRPRELAQLLRVARGRNVIVEIGTGTAWTAIALVLSDGRRRVATYDPADYEERHFYLDLLDESCRSRLDLVHASGDHPRAADSSPELVFIDSSHERDETMQTFSIWAARLAPGGAIAFHDFGDPSWPGVAEAIQALGLTGEAHGSLFVWRAPAETPRRA